MTFFWICVVLATFICIAVLFSNNDKIDETKFEMISEDVMHLLHIVAEFLNGSYWKDNAGDIHIEIKPLDNWSYLCRISLLLHEKDIGIIKALSKNYEIAELFDLELEDDTWYYVLERCFSGSDKEASYKSAGNIAKRLYNKITEEFPNVKCELSKNRYGLIFIHRFY